MTDTNEFVQNFLTHVYDPLKAHEYYLRNRELKGRSVANEIDPEGRKERLTAIANANLLARKQKLQDMAARLATTRDEIDKLSPLKWQVADSNLRRAEKKLAKLAAALLKELKAQGLEHSDFNTDDFLAHVYDPVKAREYYLRTRKLKGRGDGTTEYEKKNVSDAQTKLNSDLKKSTVKMNPKRRIDAAEQKLIRAKSLAERIKDPTVKADMLARIAAMEKKLHVVKRKHRHRSTSTHHKRTRHKKTASSSSRVYTTGRSRENQQ